MKTKKVRQQLPNAKIIYAGMHNDDQNEYTQNGGVSLIINEKWAGRITESGGDKMGRWFWATMKGQENKTITVVVMYRPNPGSISASQLVSAWRQQYEYILNKKIENNNISQYDPREASIQDFNKWLREFKNPTNNTFIIMAEMNQEIHENT